MAVLGGSHQPQRCYYKRQGRRGIDCHGCLARLRLPSPSAHRVRTTLIFQRSNLALRCSSVDLQHPYPAASPCERPRTLPIEVPAAAVRGSQQGDPTVARIEESGDHALLDQHRGSSRQRGSCFSTGYFMLRARSRNGRHRHAHATGPDGRPLDLLSAIILQITT